jgi:FtsZ-interacting cell division protein ZipA
MEIVVFVLVVISLAIYGMWRVRRVGSTDEPTRESADAADDQRYKSAFPDDHVLMRVPQQRPVSRESGHGKDGG